MNDIDGEVRIKQFQYLLNDENLYEKVIQFCEDHNVLHSFCNVLWNEVLSRSVIIKNLSTDRSSSIDKDIDVGNDTGVVLPNSHLLRYNEAIAAEIRVLTRPTDYNIVMLDIEQDILNQLLTTIFDTRIPPKRICVIHSCTLDVTQSYSHRILEDILMKIQSSGLMKELDSVLVFNYGYSLSVQLQSRYSDIVFMNVYHDSSYFEIPTLRLIHHLAKYWMQANDDDDNHYDTHILYLHTKGVSYKEIYPQIEDWRNMMLYFLVERYKTCYHLLASDEIDCIGNNFLTMKKKHFSGNYWWATSSYLSQLPELLIYGRDMKYEAEWWLLGGMHVRIFIMHSSSIDHAHQIYPRYCYDPSYSRPLSSSSPSSSIPLSSSSSDHYPHHSIYKEVRDSSVCGEKKTQILVTSLTINNNYQGNNNSNNN